MDGFNPQAILDVVASQLANHLRFVIDKERAEAYADGVKSVTQCPPTELREIFDDPKAHVTHTWLLKEAILRFQGQPAFKHVSSQRHRAVGFVAIYETDEQYMRALETVEALVFKGQS